MLRIGEAAKQYDLSSRTLRYWEERGVLKSVRMENGYRFYDDANSGRIQQIVLLRGLRMPIAEIERIFVTASPGAAIDALNVHLERLKRDAAVYSSLIISVERLIRYIRKSQNPEQMFSCLETQAAEIDFSHGSTSQFQLSERKIIMSSEQLNHVRIVRITAMMVAAYCAVSAAPEDDCSKVFNKFVLENNLHKRSGYRNFGFNNPGPRESSPVYGYEMWVSVPDDFDVPEPLEKKRFGGGLYASISTTMGEIGERWKLLYNWCKNSDLYDVDFSFQWLEECSMDFETFISKQISGSEKQLDLLEPIKQR
jgi:DNA-binding transcriptional MerR regulator